MFINPADPHQVPKIVMIIPDDYVFGDLAYRNATLK